MNNAAKRLQALISDILAFSRVTSRAKPFTEVALTEVVEGVVSDLEFRISETNAKVDVGQLPIVQADSSQMQQVFQNLISNSIKFVKSGSKLFVKIYSKTADNGDHQIMVTDNGIGFDEKYLDRIFTIFQRLHSRVEYEGTGIGLAIARKIIERHHGSLTAKSASGQGATFIITLPSKQSKGDD
jgi:light-regulated signal transduction histidine kinase (bacteriophytochrome)